MIGSGYVHDRTSRSLSFMMKCFPQAQQVAMEHRFSAYTLKKNVFLTFNTNNKSNNFMLRGNQHKIGRLMHLA